MKIFKFIIIALLLFTASKELFVISEINRIRTNQGLPSLEVSGTLMVHSEERAKDLYNKNQWSHAGLLESGNKIYPEYGVLSENLAKDFKSPSAAVSAWMNSQSHKEIILSPKHTDIGVGVYQNYTVLWMAY